MKIFGNFFEKKCQVFGNFLTVKWQFSGGSAFDISPDTCGVSDFALRSARALATDIFVTPRIVGGVVAGSCSAYPWMVRLDVGGSVCGGVVLDETHVLTAAHCVM